MENLEKKSLTQKLKQNSKNIFYSLALLIVSGIIITYATSKRIDSLDTTIRATTGDELSYDWVNKVNEKLKELENGNVNNSSGTIFCDFGYVGPEVTTVGVRTDTQVCIYNDGSCSYYSGGARSYIYYKDPIYWKKCPESTLMKNMNKHGIMTCTVHEHNAIMTNGSSIGLENFFTCVWSDGTCRDNTTGSWKECYLPK